VVDAYADDMTMTLHYGEPGTFEGKAAVVGWFTDWFTQFGRDYRFEVEEAWAVDAERVFLLATHHGRGRPSGVPVEQRSVAYLYTLKDGKIVQLEVWGDRETALEATGIGDFPQ
jgi:ketosteroid isomerase-like protein